MTAIIDMIGMRFVKLVVVERAGNSERRIATWRCLCDCGRYVVVPGDSLRRGGKQSCGCSKNAHKAMPIADRFWPKVVRDEDHLCWEWQGLKLPAGYGVLKGLPGSPKSQLLAHRVSWEINIGPIPSGLCIDHLCMNKSCVNPAHMELVTRGENSMRAMLGRTHCKHGHLFSEENTAVGRNGRRVCRACSRALCRRTYYRRKERRAA
jgi:hypothetical protein